MTQKLYYDCALTECEATVLDCREGKEGFEVLLDKTVIFPEGGGQLSDSGRIGPARVSYAFEEGADIWNRCDMPLERGKSYTVSFEREIRLDHSQQHAGEHMLSGMAAKLFGCQNVGFHMAEDYVSVDLDKPLSDEDVKRLELEVNRAVERDEPTVCRMVTPEEYEEIPLRKKAKGLEGDIRIVYVGGVDSCTCCGTHTARAGEIGLVKITSHANYKGGTRIWFVCGMRAIREMMADKAIVDAVARRFSTKPEAAVKAVIAEGDELASLRRTLKERTAELFSLRAAGELSSAPEYGGVKLVIADVPGLDAHELSIYCAALTEKGKCIVVAFSENDGKLNYRLARSNGVAFSMKEACAAVNATVNGKGGGRDDSAQGSAPARREMGEICAQLENYIKARLVRA